MPHHLCIIRATIVKITGFQSENQRLEIHTACRGHCYDRGSVFFVRSFFHIGLIPVDVLRLQVALVLSEYVEPLVGSPVPCPVPCFHWLSTKGLGRAVAEAKSWLVPKRSCREPSRPLPGEDWVMLCWLKLKHFGGSA